MKPANKAARLKELQKQYRDLTEEEACIRVGDLEEEYNRINYTKQKELNIRIASIATEILAITRSKRRRK